jgi:hypothetical protein
MHGNFQGTAVLAIGALARHPQPRPLMGSKVSCVQRVTTVGQACQYPTLAPWENGPTAQVWRWSPNVRRVWAVTTATAQG